MLFNNVWNQIYFDQIADINPFGSMILALNFIIKFFFLGFPPTLVDSKI